MSKAGGDAHLVDVGLELLVLETPLKERDERAGRDVCSGEVAARHLALARKRESRMGETCEVD
jgi:hypothetical protein